MHRERLQLAVKAEAHRSVSGVADPRLYQAVCGAASATRNSSNQAVTRNFVSPVVSCYGPPSLFHARPLSALWSSRRTLQHGVATWNM
jgi:hypothetical protein